MFKKFCRKIFAVFALLLKRYYRKKLYKELDKIIENKRKEEVNEFFRNFTKNF